MKTFFFSLLAFLVIAALGSCSKSYTCSCQVDYYDTNGAYTHTAVNTASTSAGRRGAAEDECSNTEATYDASLYQQADCTLIEN